MFDRGPELAKAKFSFFHLPSEVLRLIFINCFTQAKNRCRLTLHLASVCRFWRHIVLSTSELWSEYLLSYTRPELNTLWLARARIRPTTVNGINSFTGFGGSRKRIPVHLLLASISPYIRNMQSLSLDLDKIKDVEFTIIRKKHRDMEYSTRRDRTVLDTSREQNLTSNPLDARSILHQLKSARKPGVRYNFWGYNAIQNIEILPYILSRAEDLKALDVRAVLEYLDDKFIAKPLIHPSITHLGIAVGDQKNLVSILTVLTLPSLKELALCSCPDVCIMIAGHEELIMFLDRSECAIERLSISLGKWLFITSTLRHQSFLCLKILEFREMPLNENVLCFLADRSNLPFLRELMFMRMSLPSRDEIDLFLVLDPVYARRGRDDERSELVRFGFSLQLEDGEEENEEMDDEDEFTYPWGEYQHVLGQLRLVAQSSMGKDDALVFIGPEDYSTWKRDRAGTGHVW